MTEFEEKVLKALKDIDEKLDKLLIANSVIVPVRAESVPSGAYVKPSAVVDKQEMEEKAKGKPPAEGRRVCSECGGTAFKEEEDKTQILYSQGGMKIYQKRSICKKCGKVL